MVKINTEEKTPCKLEADIENFLLYAVVSSITRATFMLLSAKPKAPDF